MTIVLSQCLNCKHYNPSERRKHSCKAFDEIPEAVWMNQHDHRNLYPGDGGIVFEPLPDKRSIFEEVL